MLKRLLVLFLALAIASPAFAATVGMNFRFHVNSGATDVIHVNENSYIGEAVNSTFKPDKPYISAESGSNLAALIFAGGGFLNILLDSTSDPYHFRIIEEETENRFLIAVTNGTWQKVDQLAGSRRIPAQTFGGLIAPFSNPQNIYLRLHYDTLNLIGAIASGQLLVKNLGSRNIQLDLVG